MSDSTRHHAATFFNGNENAVDAVTEHVLDVIGLDKWRQIQVVREGDSVYVIQPPDINCNASAIGLRPQPAPAKCEECPNICSRATPPSAKGAAETKEAPREITLYWSPNTPADEDQVSLYPTPSYAGDASYRYIRSDVVEKRVAEAHHSRLDDLQGLRDISGCQHGETILQAIRRVVAERDEWKQTASVQEERADTAEAAAEIARADYRKACEELRAQQTKTVAAERELEEARAKLIAVSEWLDTAPEWESE